MSEAVFLRGKARKNCAAKYCVSSVERTFGRTPSTVRSHRDRKRVSRKKKPCASSGDASTSPRRSQTRKVLPSRMLIVSAMTLSPSAAAPVTSPDVSAQRYARADGRGASARPETARGRRGGVQAADRPLPRVARASCAGVRADARARRGGRAGDVARCAGGNRPLRGPLVAEDVALPHPHEPREDAWDARAADTAVLVARIGRRRGRSQPLPRSGRAVARALERAAAGLPGGAAARQRDARGDRGRDREAAGDTAYGDHAARRRRVERGGG